MENDTGCCRIGEMKRNTTKIHWNNLDVWFRHVHAIRLWVGVVDKMLEPIPLYHFKLFTNVFEPSDNNNNNSTTNNFFLQRSIDTQKFYGFYQFDHLPMNWKQTKRVITAIGTKVFPICLLHGRWLSIRYKVFELTLTTKHIFFQWIN